jgi:nucleotide-binding universal stress UspA family protein
MMIKTLLVAVDGSQRASTVVDAGVELARATHARIVLFRAVVVPPDFPAAAATSGDELPAYLLREAHEQLASFIATIPDVPCEARVRQGVQPWRDIIAVATAIDADVIVLGSHGYHGWDHILGTTAGKVVNLAGRNVFVVHPRS